MESCQVRVSAIGMLFSERISEPQTRFVHSTTQSHHAVELICPEPHRRSRVPYAFDHGLNRCFSKSKGFLPLHREDCGYEILDIIWNENDDGELDFGNQMSFFSCSSPPVRSSNPMTQDAWFTKQSIFQPPTILASPPTAAKHKQPSIRHDRSEFVAGGSPSCGSSIALEPKVRIEGFAARGTQDSSHHHIATALA